METTGQESKGLDRRALLRNGLFAGLGVAAVGIASSALARPAWASGLTVQSDWYYCGKCQGLFHSDAAGDPKGVCPADFGYHLSSGWTYEVPYSNPSQSNLQAGWTWCNLCQGLYHTQSNSRCPGYYSINGSFGPHASGDGSYSYEMLYGSASGNVQGQWKYCSRCHGLFYGPNQTTSQCPADPLYEAHNDSDSYDYFLYVAAK